MKKTICISFLTAVLSILAASCSKPSSGPDGGGATDQGGNGGNNGSGNVEIPEPPVNPVQNNVFNVDFFTDLSDGASYFSTTSGGSGKRTDLAVKHIKSQTGKKPLLYMFDRTDFEAGKPCPILAVARDAKMTSYFAQSSPSGEYIKGTAMLTLYSVKKFDGVASSGAFMSGPLISAPLNQPTPVYVYTMRINSLEEFDAVFSGKSAHLLKDGVLIGTIKPSEKEAFKTLIEKSGPMRLAYAAVDGKDYDLFVLVPASFVCRGIDYKKDSSLPYFRVSVEKLQ